MPRERSTWNVNAIAKRAGLKVADPYLMNQDHVNQQPAADEYVIGNPSDFAEDVHPAAGTWEAEYANGQVRRNEIGMPEMRGDTFNHSEKTATEEVITKKAALCVAIARKMLPKTASPVEIEDQGFSLMYLPDTEVMATYTRLAAQDQDQQQQQQVQAAQQDQQQQQQQVQAAQQDQQQQQQQQQVQAAQQQDQQQQGQQVQAGKIPPQFLENIQKKKDEAADKKDDDKGQQKSAQQDQGQQDQGQQQQKQAQQDQGQQDQGQQQQKQAQQDQQQGQQDQGQQKQAEMQQQGMQQQLAQLLQQAQQIQQQLAQSQQQQQAGQQQQQQAGQQQQQAGQQQQQAQMQQQSQAQQVAQAVQQAIQNGQDPVAAAQQCMAQYQQQGNSEIDQMLAEQGQIEPVADMDIQLDTPSMDVGEVQLSPEEDDTLRQLFASNPEYKNAQEAAGQQDQDQGQQQQKQAHVTRTASMRTVGTRPTAGVSQIGGSNRTASSQGADLSSLWNSAPDVREAFGMRTDQ